MKKIRVVVAESDALIRDGLKTILDLEEDVEVVGVARDGREAMTMVRMQAPDVVLMDTGLPAMGGLASVKLLKEKSPLTRIIMLSSFEDEDYVLNALAAGVDGFLFKDTGAAQMVASIRDVIRGEVILPARVAAGLAARALELLRSTGLKK
ncbi:response regulator [Moorella sulfitireducens]|uniref:response regulator n=1 Tax=Neomoorella sulfitireducens TaxID=2972948 RepID=UPI0021AC2C4E|nr:response regulator transcription factor [Moorella sulfitireducens]